MMNIYLKGYYGYDNLGDEYLLVGLINWLYDTYTFTTLYIEAGDKEQLNKRIQKSKKIVKTNIDNIICVSSCDYSSSSVDLIVFGGGELVTDARPFPYNGRNYLLGRWYILLHKKYICVGGIGTVYHRLTPLLYRRFLGRAEHIWVRDTTSYDVAIQYTSSVTLYHDWCYDVLDMLPYVGKEKKRPLYGIINVNTYIRNKETKHLLQEIYKKYPDHIRWYVPAARGNDDTLYNVCKEIVPGLRIRDWRTSSHEELVSFVAEAEHVVAARLHVLLLAKHYNTPFTPLVYQEKITKLILSD